MHPLWSNYVAARPPLGPCPVELIVPIGETLPGVPIIPAQRFHGKPGTRTRRSHVAENRGAEPPTSESTMIGSDGSLRRSSAPLT
jgi:hypothetical protein